MPRKKIKKPSLPQKKYLVIKHGALGDFILSTGPFAAIRARHPKSHITLLTSKPYAELARLTPYFDEVWVDPKPKFWQLDRWWQLIKRLRSANFHMVYDLQTSDRSNLYFRFLGRKKPLWSGNIDWCSHPHKNPNRNKMHTIERQRQQLRIAQIRHVPPLDVSWLTSDIKKFKLKKPFALLVPGCSPHRPEKRWNEKAYAEVARYLKERGIQPVLIGTKAEKTMLNDITSLCKGAVNLAEQTSIADIAELGRNSVIGLGSDTGPMHILAASGCPLIVLGAALLEPERSAPRGRNVSLLADEDLPNLKAAHVISLIEEKLG